jgi:hypothetical protein
MFISDAKLTGGEQDASTAQVETLIERHNVYDVLCILATVAVNRISAITDKHDRRRCGALFIREFEVLSALHESSTDREEEEETNDQEHDGSLSAAMADWDEETDDDQETDDDDEIENVMREAEAIMTGLGDFCTVYRYRAILRGVPDGISIILRDYPKEHDRNNFVLDAIASAVIRRSKKRSPETREAIQKLDTNLTAATETLGAFQNSRIRDAVILDAIDAFLKFSSCSERVY